MFDFDEKLLAGLKTGIFDKSLPSSLEFRPKLVVNDPPYRRVLQILKQELRKCTAFDFSVAFINLEGMKCLFQALTDAAEKGVKGRIITTDYLHFTQPEALEALQKFPNIEVRLYNSKNDGFHTKGYVFYKNKEKTLADVIIGSANITRNALLRNKEWNIRFGTKDSGELLNTLKKDFDCFWENSDVCDGLLLESYKRAYEAFNDPSYVKITENGLVNNQQSFIENNRIEPNSMQQEALIKLNDLRKQGQNKALVVSATGTGKTYLCAFDVKEFNPKRCLFVVHRNKILQDAMNSFKKIFRDKESFGFFNAQEKDVNNRFVFAMVKTLSKEENLKLFSPDAFDYIVIDEAHHIKFEDKTTYKRILNYFKPKFLLGLTATPQRTDGYDIYSDFDNNLAYEIRLNEAIEEGLLCPFHYFGISDVKVDGVEIIENEAINLLTADERVKHIFEKINYYSMNRKDISGLMFCSRVEEAKMISEKLNNSYGLRTLALSGKNNDDERSEAIKRLELPRNDENALDYILTVDIFNEGIDIPCINQIVLLRPTESVIVYIQQLGRGLRLYNGKESLTVLDFIGNYQNNFMIPVALFGDNSYRRETMERLMIEEDQHLIGNCTIDFDKISKEYIYASISGGRYSHLKYLQEEYFALKNKIGHIPTLSDFIDSSSISPLLLICNKKTKITNYPDFLKKVDPDFKGSFSDIELKSLSFFSKVIARGLRPQERIIIEKLVNKGKCSFSEIQQIILEKYRFIPSLESINSAINVLCNGFFLPQDKKNYGEIVYLKTEGESLYPTEEFSNLLKSVAYKEQLSQILSVGEKEYVNNYLNMRQEFDLALYQKYTRQDASMLLCWEIDGGPTIMGYTVHKKTKTCPIFVTYKKSNEISEETKYQDYFATSEIFHWQTRFNVRVDSNEVIQIIGKSSLGPLRIPLFVKKSDDEGNEFYYLGDMSPLGVPRQNKIAGKDVVDIDFLMDTPLFENFFRYFEETSEKKEAIS